MTDFKVGDRVHMKGSDWPPDNLPCVITHIMIRGDSQYVSMEREDGLDITTNGNCLELYHERN